MRAAVSNRLVTVYGGSGFIGRHVVRLLAQQGWRVRVAVRRPDLAIHLQPLGAVGQIHAVQANLRFKDSVLRAAEGSDAVINLVGILSPSGKQRFDAVHAVGAGLVAEAAREAGAKTLVHMSAIGADANSSSAYARSKAEGEARTIANFGNATILRPSVVFGPEDDFYNRFAGLARISPVLPLIGGGHTRFQPVFVGDVAQAFGLALSGEAKARTVYELGGPEVQTFRQIMEYVLKVTYRKRLLVPLPFPIAKLQGRVLQLLPNAPLTEDQVELLRTDNVVSAEAIAQSRTLEGLGIVATGPEAIVPSYLYRFRKSGQFERAPEA